MGLRTALGLRGKKQSTNASEPKFGVLTFGYENFWTFKNYLQERGTYDINLGDNAQSIAVRQLLRELHIREDQIISVNRDTLASYSGPPCSLIMNAVFFQHSFPLPPQVRPIFIGFHANATVIKNNLALFKLYEPIGCRDSATTRLLRSHGVKAFTTGCVTLTFPRRELEPENGKLLIVYGSDFPASVLKHIPAALRDSCEFIYHRLPVIEHPIEARTSKIADAYEECLMDRYRRTAKLVLTPLHHVAAPCLAAGIPVIICRSSDDDRFSFLKELSPIYLPETFHTIEWAPNPIDVTPIRDAIRSALAKAIHAV